MSTDDIDHIHPGTVAHFAINADDVGASQTFYARCFGWTYAPVGPPEFFHVLTAEGQQPGPIGALQGRRNFAGGVKVAGFECTVAVSDVDAVASAAQANGGRILMEPTTLMGVGHLIWLADPSGNVVGAMQYDSKAE
ncbi:MAG: Glyoxalase/bleomycin resistance protein/dioxygenase [Ilumatobacteraceae bacterium]|nr:Glyoxalase/bleomycin resistance protein/dioxygenase [Ilumatobacteraceae bacterium]MCU1387083.1 Glyoxalase/bleomycin resistance protein/dioxygenase [Ilumatobacteraceae bacterium]